MTEAKGRGALAADWWRERLADRASGAARGLMARLRRADALGVLAEPAVQELESRIFPHGRRLRSAQWEVIDTSLKASVNEAVDRLGNNLVSHPDFDPQERARVLRLARATLAAARRELADALMSRRPTDEEAATFVRLVQVLAEVREDAPETLARRLGGAEPVMSHLRFQRLIRAEGDEAATALRRAVLMAERRCNVARLAADLLVWDHPDWGEAARRRWIFDYFAAREADAPGADQSSEETAA